MDGFARFSIKLVRLSGDEFVFEAKSEKPFGQDLMNNLIPKMDFFHVECNTVKFIPEASLYIHRCPSTSDYWLCQNDVPFMHIDPSVQLTFSVQSEGTPIPFNHARVIMRFSYQSEG